MTTLERYIIESIKKGNKNIILLREDTCLELSQLKKNLERLIEKKVLINKNGDYSLSSKFNFTINPHKKIIEFALILKSCIKGSINEKKSNQFNLKKVYLNAEDQKQYKLMLMNIEDFLVKRSSQAYLKKTKTAKETIIFWGETTYLEIITALSAI